VNGYLLDTNVASELRKGDRADPNVRTWFDPLDDHEVFLSVLALAEIRKGIEQARSRDLAKANALERWLSTLERTYSDHLLSISAAVADQWGRLSAIRPISSIDGLLAATALVHDLTFVTRNVSDVAHTGVNLVNPFEPS
jgi:predicted nucleic acid-binding protein